MYACWHIGGCIRQSLTYLRNLFIHMYIHTCISTYSASNRVPFICGLIFSHAYIHFERVWTIFAHEHNIRIHIQMRVHIHLHIRIHMHLHIHIHQYARFVRPQCYACDYVSLALTCYLWLRVTRWWCGLSCVIMCQVLMTWIILCSYTAWALTVTCWWCGLSCVVIRHWRLLSRADDVDYLV